MGDLSDDTLRPTRVTFRCVFKIQHQDMSHEACLLSSLAAQVSNRQRHDDVAGRIEEMNQGTFRETATFEGVL